MIQVMIVEDDPMAQKLLEIFISENSGYQVAHIIERSAPESSPPGSTSADTPPWSRSSGS